MDTAQWPQEIVVKPLEEIIPSACSTKQQQQQQATGIDQRKATRPQKEQALNCPRCNSTNTKFCYYNNYSLTQPRYFCKTCRRYWTEGGSLRNIPVGGGSRKNKRSSSSATSSSSISQHMVSASNSSKKLSNSDQNPKVHDQGHDLNLAFPSQDFRISTISDFVQVPNNNIENNNSNNNKQSHLPCSSSSTSPTSHHHHHHQHQHQLSALELLTGFTSRGLNSFMPPMAIPDPNNTVYTSGFNPMQEFKPSLNFSLDGLGNGYGSLVQGVHHQETSNGRVLFPFEDLKQVSSTTDVEQNRGQGDSSGYWTGMLGGGSW